MLTPGERKRETRLLAISVLTAMDPAIPRVSPIGDLRFCAGLAAQGHRVELVAPAIEREILPRSVLFDTYELEPNFDIRYVRVPAWKGERGARVVFALFRYHLARALRSNRPPIVLSRDVRLLLPYLAATGTIAHHMVTAPWLHEFRGKRRERLVCAKATAVLATNSAILRDLEAAGVSNQRTFVTGNPVPQERVEFGRRFPKAEARRRVGLEQQRPVIAYTGKIYLGMRELDYYLEAAARMPECLFLLNGGQPPVVEALTKRLRERRITNVKLVGILSRPEESRFYQQAADVLVTYHSIADHLYADHNVPNKLAEYMTTGNPIVAAESPAVGEILNPGNAILVKRDDSDALVEALEFAIRNRDRTAALGAQAQRDVATRTTESVGAELGMFLAETAERG